MTILKKSPFKVDRVENDPIAYGLRQEQVIHCFRSLFNRQSVIISGPRGIGKSSLGFQLQKAMFGDTTLLKRCEIGEKFPPTLPVFYACDSEITLEGLVLDLLFRLEQKVILIPEYTASERKITFEVNLVAIKAGIESTSTTSKRSPSTIASQFVHGINVVLNSLRSLHLYNSINFMIDEIDLLPESINLGHFIKIVHETLTNLEIAEVTFILAGQEGVYTRLCSEEKSFERIVTNVNLTTLDVENANYVLDYASGVAKPEFEITEDAKDLILSLASGFPYVLHYIGNSAFLCMRDPEIMRKSDVLLGITEILQNDRKEKYLNSLLGLTQKEYLIIIALTQIEFKSLPAYFLITKLIRKVEPFIPDQNEVINILKELELKKYLKIDYKQNICAFYEELFRIFVTLVRIEKREDELIRNFGRDGRTFKNRIDLERQSLTLAYSERLELGNKSSGLQNEDKNEIIKDYVDNINKLALTNMWVDKNIFDDDGSKSIFED